MAEVSHTRGPWFIFDEKDFHLGIESINGTSVIIFGKEGEKEGVRGVTEEYPYLQNREVILANARLIAASPELLTELKALVARYEFDGIPNDSLPYVQRAKAAISKAEGGRNG